MDFGDPGNWTGYGYNLSPNANMTFEWPTDTVTTQIQNCEILWQ